METGPGRPQDAPPSPGEAAGLSLEKIKQLVSPSARAEALWQMGRQVQQSGRPEEAEGLYQEALAALRSSADRRLLGTVLSSLADLYRAQGKTAEALQSYDHAVEQFLAQSALDEEKSEQRRKLAIGAGKFVVKIYAGPPLTEATRNMWDAWEHWGRSSRDIRDLPTDSVRDFLAALLSRLTRLGLWALFVAMLPSLLLILQIWIAFGQNRIASAQKDIADAQNKIVLEQKKIEERTRRTELVAILYERRPAAPGSSTQIPVASTRTRSEALLEFVALSRAQAAEKAPAADADAVPLVDLAKAALSEVVVKEADLRNLDLKAAVLSGADFSKVDFSRSKFVGAKMHDVFLDGSKLNEAILSYADLSEANISGTTFENTDFNLADFNGATLGDVDLSRARNLTQKQLDEACSEGGVKVPKGMSPPPKC